MARWTSKVFTSIGATTFVVPAGVRAILVQGIGAGGGGAQGAGSSSATSKHAVGGGGGGAAKESWDILEVTPGETLSINVPAGGLGSVAQGGEGATGGPSWIATNGQAVANARMLFGGGQGGTSGADSTATVWTRSNGGLACPLNPLGRWDLGVHPIYNGVHESLGRGGSGGYAAADTETNRTALGKNGQPGRRHAAGPVGGGGAGGTTGTSTGTPRYGGGGGGGGGSGVEGIGGAGGNGGNANDAGVGGTPTAGGNASGYGSGGGGGGAGGYGSGGGANGANGGNGAQGRVIFHWVEG